MSEHEKPSPENKQPARNDPLDQLKEIVADAGNQFDNLMSPENVDANRFPMHYIQYLFDDGPLDVNKLKLGEFIQITADELDTLLDFLQTEVVTIIDAQGRPIRIVRGCIQPGKILTIRKSDLGSK